VVILNSIGGQKWECITMAGTKAGGQKAANTNKTKYGKDFYAEIGRKGGHNGHTGGFAANPELAKIAGAKGGRISKRGKAKKNA
jgi:general stress protein YciG